jgi:hypothetical protein
MKREPCILLQFLQDAPPCLIKQIFRVESHSSFHLSFFNQYTTELFIFHVHRVNTRLHSACRAIVLLAERSYG